MNTSVLVIAVAIVIFIFMYANKGGGCNKDYYGQDASIRASSGWIAGPIYGQDPIQQYANQIANMRTFKNRKNYYNSFPY
ncbi:hypothetical protein OAG24_00550 [bacterium]|nr:hypothetical protein [bacterium]